jgi:hypothetical protein
LVSSDFTVVFVASCSSVTLFVWQVIQLSLVGIGVAVGAIFGGTVGGRVVAGAIVGAWATGAEEGALVATGLGEAQAVMLSTMLNPTIKNNN